MTTRDLRIFAGILATGFAIIGAVAFYRTRALPTHPWAFRLWTLSSVLLVTGLVAPPLLRPVHTVWMALAHVMERVNTRLILTVTFFGLFTPLGLIRRLLGHDPLRVRRPAEATLWTRRTPREGGREGYRRMY